MTNSFYSKWQSDTPEPTAYINRHGDLYQMPSTRAELVRHLHFQRRLVSHLVDVITYVTRDRGMQL